MTRRTSTLTATAMPEPVAIREQIVSRVVAILLQGLAGVTVDRSRQTALTRETSPALVVTVAGEETDSMGDAADRHHLELTVGHFVRGDPWDQLAAASDQAAHRILAGEDALQGLAEIRRTGTDMEAMEADETAGVLNVRYRLTFLTSRHDIARPPT